MHPNAKTKVMPNESTIPTYMRYFHVAPSKFVCANSNFQNEFPFCVPVPFMKRRGWPIFSMLGIIFSRRVFINMSLHENVACNRDAQCRNEKNTMIINSLKSVGIEGTRGYG